MTESFLPGNRELHDALRKQLELLQQLKRHRGMLQHENINVRVCVPDGRNRSRRTCYAPIKIEALCVAPNVFLIFYPHKVMYATPRRSLWPCMKALSRSGTYAPFLTGLQKPRSGPLIVPLSKSRK